MATQGRKPKDTERCIRTELQIGRYTVHEYMSTQIHHGQCSFPQARLKSECKCRMGKGRKCEPDVQSLRWLWLCIDIVGNVLGTQRETRQSK